MFETLDTAPPDAILGLSEAFQNDPNPDKINLTVGVYKDASGQTPILDCVKQAERRLLDQEAGKGYLGIDGLPPYRQQVQELLFGVEHDIVSGNRAATLQTPGGTGALRVAADFLSRKFPQASIWCSKPTWANHPNIFAAAGLTVHTYDYLDASGTGLDFEAWRTSLANIPVGDVVCLHACCHNPTGIDPTNEQWKTISGILQERSLLPLVDFAYQGFGDGLNEDASGLGEICRNNRELLVCNSFSKNFGLYAERVGGLTIVADSADAAQAALSHAKACVRSNYSNPPKHGATIVSTILGDADLRARWEAELAAMRDRINDMRTLFVSTMKDKSPQHDFGFLTRQRGMFSFSGLTRLQVDQLRTQHAIYIVGSGRVNVAGITPANAERLCDAVASVLG